MDRLTHRAGNGAVPTELDLWVVAGPQHQWRKLGDIIQRLAEYEETAYLPEKIHDLIAENARLRDDLRRGRDAWNYLYSALATIASGSSRIPAQEIAAAAVLGKWPEGGENNGEADE